MSGITAVETIALLERLGAASASIGSVGERPMTLGELRELTHNAQSAEYLVKIRSESPGTTVSEPPK